MKKAIFPRIGSLFLAVLFLAGTGFRPSGNPAGEGETRIFIDGKEVVPEGMITLDKDETVLLEATGLKPNSEIYIKVKKAGIRWAEDTYLVGESGTLKELLDVPERELTVNCYVTYYDGLGSFHSAEFKLRVN